MTEWKILVQVVAMQVAEYELTKDKTWIPKILSTLTWINQKAQECQPELKDVRPPSDFWIVRNAEGTWLDELTRHLTNLFLCAPTADMRTE